MTRSNPSVSREFRLSFIESPQGTTTSVNFCRDIFVVKNAASANHLRAISRIIQLGGRSFCSICNAPGVWLQGNVYGVFCPNVKYQNTEQQHQHEEGLHDGYTTQLL